MLWDFPADAESEEFPAPFSKDSVTNDERRTAIWFSFRFAGPGLRILRESD